MNSCCNFVLPIPSDASIIKGFIVIIPVYVLLIIGKSAYIIKAISAVVFPTPVIVIKNPNSAIEGIVYSILTVPNINPENFLYSLIIIPRIIPNTLAILIANNEIKICSTVRLRKNLKSSVNNFIN